MTPSFWIHVLLLGQEKTREQSLPLQESIVLIWIVCMIWIFDRQDVISECGNHEQLLVQTVHVADARQVFDTNTAGA